MMDWSVTRKRPVSRSRLTNDPLALPAGLRGTTAQGRRWLDLVAAYQERLGARMRHEHVRALVASLVSFSLLNERLNAEVARGEKVNPQHVIQITQAITCLLDKLGLHGRDSAPFDVTPYLRNLGDAP
jgi:hypothetical protein